MSHEFLQVLPSTLNKERYLYEIRNRSKWVLLMGGERVLLYKRRWDGARCPKFDKVRMQHPQVETCDVCYGTGYVQGYLRPIEIYVSLASPVPQQLEIQETGIRRTYLPVTWTLWEPGLASKDMFVRRNGERHWIINVQETRWHHHVLRQILSTELIEQANQLYKIPI